MLRELNENEMEMVSGGWGFDDSPPEPDPNEEPVDEVIVTAQRIDDDSVITLDNIIVTGTVSAGATIGGTWGSRIGAAWGPVGSAFGGVVGLVVGGILTNPSNPDFEPCYSSIGICDIYETR